MNGSSREPVMVSEGLSNVVLLLRTAGPLPGEGAASLLRNGRLPPHQEARPHGGNDELPG